jgi:hypothetical protein
LIARIATCYAIAYKESSQIIYKTFFRKMSEAGHQAALKLMLPEEQTALVAKALA